MQKTLGLSLAAALFTSAYAVDVMVDSADLAAMKAQIEALTKKIEKIEKAQKKSDKKTKRLASSVSDVKKATGGDNVKFDIDFRNSVDVLDYKDNLNHQSADNPALLTSRFLLNMAAAPVDGLIFKGQLAVNAIWGAHVYDESTGLKDWSASSKATDTVARIREAYFVYSDTFGEQPWSVSIGRRPSTNGFLANYRENEDAAGSPLAHITNMEVNGAMLKLDWDRFLGGAYTKFVYGRAHTGPTSGVYSKDITTQPWGPYADDQDTEDISVDFFVTLGDAYNDGQYQVMYEWAHIFNTKGKNLVTSATKIDAGEADLVSVGLKVDGVGDGISDFLDETTLFVSGAYTIYNASAGHSLMGSASGGTRQGKSIWLGAVIPDMITDSGKLGFEYNHGSRYWTPMTWAEDTASGSKIAVRGDAYEAYWNFDLFGVENLPSQIRYTYTKHDWTPNINCAGWVGVEHADIDATDLRLSVSYKY